MGGSNTSFSARDTFYMEMALSYAERGLYTTSPNPRVGCVSVKDDVVLSVGWHKKTGGEHAEIDCFQGHDSRIFAGSTLYITLEPCCHRGLTPPCVDEIIKKKIQRVVFSCIDPNPHVAGSSIEKLKQHGVLVDWGLLEDAAKQLNCGFFKRMLEEKPWVRIKAAFSVDGKMALSSGESQWITGFEARADSHHWRARSCGIITGIGTIIKDDPQLTVRHKKTTRQPTLVILDTHLRLPMNARCLAENNRPVIVAHCNRAPEKEHELQKRSIETIFCRKKEGRIDLLFLLGYLAQEKKMNEVLVEAGPTLISQFYLEEADEMVCYIGAKALGKKSTGLFNFSIDKMNQAKQLSLIACRTIGNDVCLMYRLHV